MSASRRTCGAVASLCMALLCACSRSSATGDTGKPEPMPVAQTKPQSADRTDDGLMLSAQEVAKLGITVAAAPAARYTAQIEGFGLVVGRDVIAQAFTDVVTARAAERQSRATLARIRRLAGTAGADSATVRENAERQAVADRAALELAEAKAWSVVGQRAPGWGDDSLPLLRSLAAGRVKIVRVTFPLGSFNTAAPASLRVSRLDAPAGDSGHIGALWDAPADSSIPGRSYFAVLENSDLTEGEHLLAWATDSASQTPASGVFVPATALVVSANQYWCYTQRKSGAFSRVPVDVNRPQSGGYFVSDGITPGELVVTSGAGLLLARELNPSAPTEP